MEGSTYLLCDRVDSIIEFEPLVRLSVVLVEFLSDVGADVSKPLLDGLCCLQGLLRGDPRLPLSQQLLNEVCDISTSNGNVLDTTANDITFSLGGERERE
jgi:hypothetical protein